MTPFEIWWAVQSFPEEMYEMAKEAFEAGWDRSANIKEFKDD